MNQLKTWFASASQSEKNALAEGSGTSLGMLYQLAGGYRSGGEASVRAGLARRLEHVAAELKKKNPKLPELWRIDIAPECRGCDFALKCMGRKAVALDFDVIKD